MYILVTFVALYLMHQWNKMSLFPLKIYKYLTTLCWGKLFSKCRRSRFYFMLLLVFPVISLVLTLATCLFDTNFLGSYLFLLPACKLDSAFLNPRPYLSNGDLWISRKLSKVMMLFSILSYFLRNTLYLLIYHTHLPSLYTSSSCLPQIFLFCQLNI